MPTKLTLLLKVSIITAVCLLVQLAFIIRIAYLYQALHNELELSARAVQLSGSMSTISNLWSQLGAEFPGSVTSPELAAAKLSEIISLLEREFGNIVGLVAGNKKQCETIGTIGDNLNRAGLLLTQADDNGIFREQMIASLQQVSVIAESGAASSRQLMKEFAEEQDSHREQAANLGWALNTTLCALIVANIEMAVLVAFFFIAAIAKKTAILAQNTNRIANNTPLHEPLKGNDELADLDDAIRRMSVALAETVRKERAVIENARDLIFTLDAQQVFRALNPAAKLILGYSPEELVNRRFIDYVTLDHCAIASDWLKTTAASAKRQRFECRMLAKDGVLIDVLLSAYWSELDKTYSCTGHDMTQHRTLERMKRQFVAMISHDLRTPLSSILNMLIAIQEKIYSAKSEKGTMRIQGAINNVDRMVKLTNDLLEIGTFETSSLSVVLETIEISSAINESLASVQAYAENRGVSISVDLEQCSIEADRLRLVQVLVNLLSNAVKFSPFGGTVSVSCIRAADHARVEITDCGPGISQEDQSIIFEPYRQSADSQKNQHMEGTGLGLTICRSIVEAHHGAIGVANAQPKGSTFWIEIPLSA